MPRIVGPIRPFLQSKPGAESGSNSTYREFVTTIKPKVKDLDPREVEEWSVTGRVRSAVRLDVPELWFEDTSRLAPLPAAKTAVVKSFVELDHLTATCSSPRFAVSAERLPPGTEGYSIRVAPRERTPVGPFRESVRIAPYLVGGKELPAMVLPIVGQILPDIEANPPCMALGVQKTGAEVQEFFTLGSRTGSAFEVRSVRATGEGLAVMKRADSISGDAYAVRQEVLKSGDQRGVVTLEIRAADGVIEKLTVEVLYYGLPPCDSQGR